MRRGCAASRNGADRCGAGPLRCAKTGISRGGAGNGNWVAAGFIGAGVVVRVAAGVRGIGATTPINQRLRFRFTFVGEGIAAVNGTLIAVVAVGVRILVRITAA